MNIIYCEKCGHRISKEEINDGEAVETGENQWLCRECHEPVPQAKRPKSGQAAPPVFAPGPSQAAAARRSTSTHIPRRTTSTDARRDSAKESSKEGLSLPVIAAIGVGGLSLIVGLVLLFSGPKPKEDKPGDAAVAVVENGASTPPAVNAPTATAPATTQMIEMKPPDRALAPAAPDATAVVTNEDRAKQFEKEMEDFRNQRARRVLDEHIAWYQKNPTEGWDYKIRLQEFLGTYGSSPAAPEARKIVDGLKDLKPPPDQLDVAAPEAKDYQLVYDLNLARLGQSINYTVNNRAAIKKPFDRIAYFLELQKKSGESQYIYISMDAFTDDLGKIGVPTLESGARFQQKVTKMNVIVNANGVTGGSELDSGNIEFWPNNYGPNNAANVPNASQDKFDFGDAFGPPDQGYGSMQIHNHAARQTLFAINHWSVGDNADIGIGNSPSGNPDWTFANNGSGYRTKRLRVFVKLK